MHFAGYLERDTELLDCYAAADVFVFASRTETQGLVLLEAMAQGAPVVSTAELGTRSILNPGCGALVVPEEQARIRRRRCVRVLSDPGLRARHGGSAAALTRAPGPRPSWRGGWPSCTGDCARTGARDAAHRRLGPQVASSAATAAASRLF